MVGWIVDTHLRLFIKFIIRSLLFTLHGLVFATRYGTVLAILRSYASVNREVKSEIRLFLTLTFVAKD